MILSNVQTIDVFVNSAKLNDLKILHLSDLHINKKTNLENVQKLVNLCNDLVFDFCVITGDIIDTKVKFIKEQLQILNTLKFKVYYISGNHDFFYGLEDLKNELSNFIFMDNSCKEFIYKNETIFLSGLPIDFQNFLV